MTCYRCEADAETGFTFRYAVQGAVGVCGRCHVGACMSHGLRDGEHGFVCKTCAKALGILPRPAEPTARPERPAGLLKGIFGGNKP